MTPQERKVIELALEALQFALHVGFPESSESQIKKGEKAYQQHRAAITAIKEALAQPEQPKVRTGDCLLVGVCASEGHKIQVKQEPWRESASDYERGVIDGRQMQAQSSVDKAVNRMAQPEQEPVAYLCENAVGHKYFRWKKPSSTYKPIALYTIPPPCPTCEALARTVMMDQTGRDA